LANAEGSAERARDQIEDINSQERARCSKAVNDFEDVGRRANGMVGGLEQLILGMEPRTPSEALSLALILAGELDVFLCNHLKTEGSAVGRERRQLEDALQAVIRGLIYGAGATSPLLDAYSTRRAMRPWADARAEAATQAGPYLVQYDPVKGCLKNTEAAR
jgi:hypothetical protein